ncbi:hypothetical protein [Thalassospira marina]|uniref:Uncharacterized protein n=1 Tax=Thalassospira marina TaxID=2048283 RepID=A0A2N3KZR3_9PROT|nr:hypothetical protein [Thalassospira marina]PKR56065.1 hypothetical protein COO20_02335 [Thalassospira marina]
MSLAALFPRFGATKTRLGLFAWLGAGLVALPGAASAMDVAQARAIVQKIMAQHDITATEKTATSHDGTASFRFDDVHLPLGGYEGNRDLVMSNVQIDVKEDGKNPQLATIGFALPEQGRIEADETINQRNLTLHDARGTINWNTKTSSPEGFTGLADFLGADEPVSRQHWLLSDLQISWLKQKVDLAWRDAEWTGPNREKMGAMKAADLSLYPDSDGTTRMDYSHDGMWMPGLFQPRTVRLKGHATGVQWSRTRPILQRGLTDLLAGENPAQVRNNIGNDLWHEALKTGKPIDIEDLYVESRNLEAAGTGEFVPQEKAAYGFQGLLDLDLVGRDQLEYLLGTPKNPTILGALFPPAVDGLAAGKPGKQGINKYKVQLLADGRITVNGRTVMSGPGS